MNKNDLVGVVADKASITKAQAAEAVDAVFDAVTGALKGGPDSKEYDSAKASANLPSGAILTPGSSSRRC